MCKYLIITVISLFFLTSCTFLATSHFAHKYGKTKGIKAGVKINSKDTLAIIKPFVDSYYIKNYKAANEVWINKFIAKLNDSDYVLEHDDYFYRYNGEYSNNYDGEIGSSQYLTKFLKPFDRFFKGKINYNVPKIKKGDLLIIRRELSEIKKMFYDSCVSEAKISDSLYTILSCYHASKFLVTDILEYHVFSPKYLVTGPDVYSWYRIFIFDLKSRKIIFYHTTTEFTDQVIRDRYWVLKYSLRKLKYLMAHRS